MSEIWTIGGNDVHPVLYYWCLRLVCLLTGGSIIAYKIFSIIPIAIMIILGYTHIRKDFGEKTGFIFSFLSAFLPVMSLYAVEVRMYSLAILAVTLVAVYAYRLSKEDNTKNWIIFGLSSLASIYLHYYGLMSAGLINVALLVYLIIKKRKRGLAFILSFGVIQAIAYLPWLVSLATQMGNVSSGYWIGFSYPKTLMELLSSQLTGYINTVGDWKDLSVPTVLALELYGYVIYKAYKYLKNKQDIKPFIWSVVMYFAVIIAAIILTALMGTSILYYRYLFVITGLYIFTISFILSKEENNKIIWIICAILTILAIATKVKMIKECYSKNNFKQIEYLQNNIQEGDKIVYREIGHGSTIAVFFPENEQYFYNPENWNVEEAYKALGNHMHTYTNTDFMENIEGRVWIIDTMNQSVYNQLFNNEGYKLLSEEKFLTDYHGYSLDIILVEKIEK